MFCPIDGGPGNVARSRLLTLGVSFVLVGLLGCVEKAKYEESQKQLAEAQKQLKETQKQLEETQRKLNEESTPKFSTVVSGSRTFRFNPQTGGTCILLTTEADWKNKRTKSQSCDCVDWNADFGAAMGQARTVEERNSIRDSWMPLIKDACGQ